MEKYIVRYADLKPCKTAFIDTHTPGSDQKDNFTIIGSGVSESADQFVHISETPGFNIGAAGQPPKCFNSLHYHNTAEVFFVLKGRWRFFWGRYGEAGEVVLNEGDIFNIPTRVFRGFENIGDEYGMIMAVLGGDDSGGGVIWAPQVLDAASSHGLILSETGQLYDTKKGETLPHGQNPVSKLTDKDLSKKEPCLVIGEEGLIKDKPGFEVEFISSKSIAEEPYSTNLYEVLMPVKGDWKLSWQGHETILNSGDTCLLKPGIEHSLIALDESESSLYRITNTDDSAGLTWKE